MRRLLSVLGGPNSMRAQVSPFLRMEDVPFDLRALRVILCDKNAPDWGGWLDDYYETSYKPAINDSGLEPHRAYLLLTKTPKPASGGPANH